VKADEWLVAVQEAASQYLPHGIIHSEMLRKTRVKVRIDISEDAFADLFFREETGRVDYTLIVSGLRYYGIDNLGDWHEHPVGHPQQHIAIGPLTPVTAIERLSKAVEKLQGV
jgi:hypothetical protein